MSWPGVEPKFLVWGTKAKLSHICVVKRSYMFTKLSNMRGFGVSKLY